MADDQRALRPEPAADESGAQSVTAAAEPPPTGQRETTGSLEAGVGPTPQNAPAPLAQDAPEPEPAAEALAAVVDPVTVDDVAAVDADASDGSDEPADASSEGGDLEELTLPSLVHAP